MPKTPDEIKKQLANNIPVHYHPGDHEPRLTPLMMVDLEELHADALARIQQLESQAPRWISVEERMPETQTTVMLALKRDGGGIRIAIGYRAHWTPARYYIDGGNCAVDANRVTHWMPLPEPPKEENQK